LNRATKFVFCVHKYPAPLNIIFYASRAR
jgi:hypothetical protein